jgi:hypothetical protein
MLKYAAINRPSQPTPPADAVQEQSTESVPVRQQPEARQGVREEDTQGQEAPQEGEAVQEEVTAEDAQEEAVQKWEIVRAADTPLGRTYSIVNKETGEKFPLAFSSEEQAQKQIDFLSKPKVSEQLEGIDPNLLEMFENAVAMEERRKEAMTPRNQARAKAQLYNSLGKRDRRSPQGVKLLAEIQQLARENNFEVQVKRAGGLVVKENGKEIRRKPVRRAAEDVAASKEDKERRKRVLQQEPMNTSHLAAILVAGDARFNKASLLRFGDRNIKYPNWMVSEDGGIVIDKLWEMADDFGMTGIITQENWDGEAIGDFVSEINAYATRNGRNDAFEYADEMYQRANNNGYTDAEVADIAAEMGQYTPDPQDIADNAFLDQLSEEEIAEMAANIEQYENSNQFIQDAERYTETTREATDEQGTGDSAQEVQRTESERKAIAKRLRDKKIGGVSFVDPLFGAIGISKTLYDGALELAAKQVEKGTKIGTAIANAIKYIDERMSGKKWDKGLFGRHLNDQFKMTVNGKEVEVKRDLSEETLEVVNGWYSPLEKTIKDIKADSLTAKDWLGRVRSKEGEDMWTGLRGMLEAKNPKDRVSKRELLNYLKDNRVDVVEVVKGEGAINPSSIIVDNTYNNINDQLSRNGIADEEGVVDLWYNNPTDANWVDVETFLESENIDSEFLVERSEMLTEREELGINTKFSQYQLEGEKENYKEVLVTLPSRSSSIDDVSIDLYGIPFNQLKIEFPSSYQERESRVKEVQKRTIESGEGGKQFRSSHFDEPNILVHLRINTRKDADGNKVLFLEEVQSDFGQSYKKGTTTIKAPFITDTNSWVKLGVKVALKEAVAKGVDRIAWTTGEQQNERYDLSKQVNEIKVEAVEEADGVHFVDIELSNGKTENIEVENGVVREGAYKGQSLEDVIGKEYAEKVLSTPRGETKRLRGADLKLGGKGMKGFYGSPKEGSKGILGSVMEAITGQEVDGISLDTGDAKYDAEKYNGSQNISGIPGNSFIKEGDWIIKDKNGNLVWSEDGDLSKSEAIENFKETSEEAGTPVSEGSGVVTQPSISITPELRSAVEKGLPLFGTSIDQQIEDLKTKIREDLNKSGFAFDPKNSAEDARQLGKDISQLLGLYLQKGAISAEVFARAIRAIYEKSKKGISKENLDFIYEKALEAFNAIPKPEKPTAPVAKPSGKAIKKEARGIGEAVKKLSEDVRETANEMTSTEGRKETDDKFNEAHDEAFEFAENELSGIMNALVPEDKKGVYQKERRTVKETLERGKAMIQSGAIDPAAFVQVILKSPRPLTADETAAMVYYKASLDARIEGLTKQSNEARENGDVEGVSLAELAISEVEAQMDSYYQFQEASGYEQGLSLKMRQLLITKEYELANQVRKYKRETGKTFVPAEVMAKFKLYDEAIRELSKRIDEFEKKSEEASESLEILSEPDPDKPKTKSDAAKLFANKVRQKKFVKSAKQLATLQSDPTGLFKFAWDSALEFIATTVEQGGTIADAVDGAIDKLKNSEWYKNLSQKGKDAFENTAKTSLSEEAMEYAGISVPTLTDGFLHIPDSFVKDLIKNGFDTIETATTEARRFLLENLGIEATERQVRDAISDYGKRSKLSKDEVSQKMREMKRVGKLLSALEDVQRKKRPLRSGRERDAMTQKEREIKREINALLKDIPQTSEETDAAWKSALDATKARLRNRIEDVQKQIAEGKKTPKRKSIELDAEAKYLKEEVDRLNEILRSIEGKPEMTFEQRVRITEQAIERSIQEYERRIREKDFEPLSKEPVSTPEIEALRAKREQLKKQYSEEYSKSPAKDTARDSAAMKRLQKQIDELTEKIHGRIPIESNREAAKERPAHVKAMQERVKSLREALMETEQGKALAEKRALENMKKAATRSIQEYERRIREKDFAVKKSRQVALDAEAKALKAEQQKWKNRFDTEREKSRLDERTRTERLREGLVDIIGVPKSLVASLDFSSVLRQGGLLSARHPKMAVSATKEMIKQTFSEAAYEKWMDEFIVSDIYNDAKKAGLYIATPNAKLLAKEESFVSNIAEMIPIYGRLVRASNRAYSSYLNVMRIAVFSDFQDQIDKSGLSEKDAELAKKDMAAFINNATGRGSLLGYEPNSPELNLLFFSPRFVLSRANIVMNTATGYAAYHPKVRKEALLTVATYVSAVTTLILLATMAGADAEDDPRSSDFGKIRIGKLRLDPLAGLSQMVVFFSRMITGKQKKLSTGEVEDVRRGRTIRSFLRSKASPSATLIVDALDWQDEKVNRSIIEKNKKWGVPEVIEFENKVYFKNIVGEEQTIPERAISLITPIYTQGAVKIYQEEGLLMAAAATGSDIIGIGSQYHSTAGTNSAAATLSKSEKELEKEMSGFKEKMAEKLYEKKGDNFLLSEDQANIGVSKSAYGDYTVNDYNKLFKNRYSQITAKDLPDIKKSDIRESHNATVLRNKDPKLSEHILSKDGEGVSVKNPVQVASSMHGAGIKELTEEQKALLRKFYGANKKGSELGKIESELKKLQSK